jgi:hypothetical protein
VTGSARLGNGMHGVSIANSNITSVGFSSAGSGNVISANGGAGVRISGSFASTNTLQRNYIGTDATGTVNLGNGSDGVWIVDAGSNSVGSSLGNTIAFNGRDGVRVEGSASTGNRIATNSISNNAGLGINLGADAVTPNDDGAADVGPNNLQNFPLLTSVITNGVTTSIQGAFNSRPNFEYTIQFFSSPSCDPSGNGEGREWIGDLVLNTDASGNAAINVSLPFAVPPGRTITATATFTDATVSTRDISEFSPCLVAQGIGVSTTSLSPNCQSFSPAADTGTVNVFAAGSWTAVSSDPSWLTITSSPTGSGTGVVTYSVAANPTANRRSATLTINGDTVTVRQGGSFADVPPSHPFFTEISKLHAQGITVGCTPSSYCPDQPTTREQMAAFIIRALGDVNPPMPAMQRFQDVPPANPFYAFIEQMAVRQITMGCSASPPLYCPTSSVTREQTAAFIIRALHNPGYVPPAPASQRFQDVSPTNPFYAHIEEMAVRGITLGCLATPPLYCPTQNVSRGQMAAFLIRAFPCR